MSSDLYLCRKTKHTKHRSMDTLIVIEFWDRDIIFDFFDQWSIMFVNNSQNHIAITHRIGDNSIRE